MYPYKERNRTQGDCIEVHEKEFDASEVGAGTDLTHDINLPYNAWTLHGLLWAEDTDAALTVQVKPYIDHEQTLVGNAMGLVEIGTSAVVTLLSIAATTPITGYAFAVLAGTGTLATFSDRVPAAHGFQVSVSAATTPTTGEAEFEFICIPAV